MYMYTYVYDVHILHAGILIYMVKNINGKPVLHKHTKMCLAM